MTETTMTEDQEKRYKQGYTLKVIAESYKSLFELWVELGIIQDYFIDVGIGLNNKIVSDSGKVVCAYGLKWRGENEYREYMFDMDFANLHPDPRYLPGAQQTNQEYGLKLQENVSGSQVLDPVVLRPVEYP